MSQLTPYTSGQLRSLFDFVPLPDKCLSVIFFTSKSSIYLLCQVTVPRNLHLSGKRPIILKKTRSKVVERRVGERKKDEGQ